MKTIEEKRSEIIAKYMNRAGKHNKHAKNAETIKRMNTHINLSRIWIERAKHITNICPSYIPKIYSDEFN